MPFEHYDQLLAEQILSAHWMMNIPQLHQPNKEKKEMSRHIFALFKALQVILNVFLILTIFFLRSTILSITNFNERIILQKYSSQHIT